MPSAPILEWTDDDDGASARQVPVAPQALEGLGLIGWVVLGGTGLAFWAGTIIGILALIGVGV